MYAICVLKSETETLYIVRQCLSCISVVRRSVLSLCFKFCADFALLLFAFAFVFFAFIVVYFSVTDVKEKLRTHVACLDEPATLSLNQRDHRSTNYKTSLSAQTLETLQSFYPFKPRGCQLLAVKMNFDTNGLRQRIQQAL